MAATRLGMPGESLIFGVSPPVLPGERRDRHLRVPRLLRVAAVGLLGEGMSDLAERLEREAAYWEREANSLRAVAGKPAWHEARAALLREAAAALREAEELFAKTGALLSAHHGHGALVWQEAREAWHAVNDSREPS
jgi:hypothetical protein